MDCFWKIYKKTCKLKVHCHIVILDTCLKILNRNLDLDENHEGARHCGKPLGRSVEQSFNKLAYKSVKIFLVI